MFSLANAHKKRLDGNELKDLIYKELDQDKI